MLNDHSLVYEDMRHFFERFPSRAHPIGLPVVYPLCELGYCANFLNSA
jgi:hypothetical protein